MTAQAIPITSNVACPRCSVLRDMDNLDGQGTYRCKGCEWTYTASAVSPTGSLSGTHTAGVNALTVASGGASFTSGMAVLIDTSSGIEIAKVTGTPSSTNIPLAAGLAKTHSGGATFGQLALTPKTTASDKVPAAPGWGF